MPAFCDVALPVPLDQNFTYAIDGVVPVVGARVLVPFSGQRLMGVVIRLHDDPLPEGVQTKPVQQVLDSTAILTDELMRLAAWIAQYYVAPLGEVLRGMLPLAAEVKRNFVYRIAEPGRKVLYQGAEKGSSRRSRLSPEDQNREYAVLNYLEDGTTAKASALRAATQANKALLDGMVKKKWLIREAVAEERDARRLERVAVLAPETRLPKLNANQTTLLAELAAVGGRMKVADIRSLGIPDSTLGTLVKRGLVTIEEVPEDFFRSSTHPVGKKHAHEHPLNESQLEALSSIVISINQKGFRPHLLFGITGSGKTAVYFAAMQRVLDQGHASLLLVPEIGLTPAMSGQMYAAFGDAVALLHSQLTPDERAEQWHRIRRGEARIVVGTRSAVFAPIVDLGLIIVDEEHDSSYKQEETPRYHGRDVAVMRAKFLEIPVVLGSATPSLESWSNAEKGRYSLIEMRQRVANRPIPAVELVDMRTEFQQTGQENLFSRQLLLETQATLDRGEQAIILLNRRGYSFVVMCRSCGDKIQCENCAISMTFHKHLNNDTSIAEPGERLQCHYCGFRRNVPKTCPTCQSEHLYYLGAGSQQGEERLQELFPNARIGRMDRDTVRGRMDMERLLARLHAGEINLLVGTQMIAKGHDIHGVTLVGVVGADFALGLPDFRAAERTFQLLTQVSGRAGRGDLPGKVLVQTYHPDHYAIQFAANHDYPGFVAKELQYRRWMHYPPFAVLANIIIQSPKLEEATAWSATLGKWFERTRLDKIRVLGPAAAPISRIKRIYRFHFVLKAEQRNTLSRTLRAMLAYADTHEIPRRSLIVDVDAVHLM
ncbi:primosomal protein N' (replication factor Y) [Granulicella aggregans]|uniref:Replication restart protein PriA n=1 Tax=Granulicella aggregans TaxID=474949 RepID=A0A7W8E512_9BACT|nr:primosomal protein N' [Granulicella aggregans]MBB5059207.1 primosomal protein N' (replication factor Y) [Granulicella aggregans]